METYDPNLSKEEKSSCSYKFIERSINIKSTSNHNNICFSHNNNKRYIANSNNKTYSNSLISECQNIINKKIILTYRPNNFSSCRLTKKK